MVTLEQGDIPASAFEVGSLQGPNKQSKPLQAVRAWVIGGEDSRGKDAQGLQGEVQGEAPGPACDDQHRLLNDGRERCQSTGPARAVLHWTHLGGTYTLARGNFLLKGPTKTLCS